MTPAPDREYFLVLAKLHRQLADEATDSEVRRLNDKLAYRYQRRAEKLNLSDSYNPPDDPSHTINS